MPYRRLPNTDQARLKALKTAIEKLENQNFTHQIVPFKAVHEAKSFLNILKHNFFNIGMHCITKPLPVNNIKKIWQQHVYTFHILFKY